MKQTEYQTATLVFPSLRNSLIEDPLSPQIYLYYLLPVELEHSIPTVAP